MQTTTHPCPACKASTSPSDRFCGECGAELPLVEETKTVVAERGEIPTVRPLALAAAVRVQFSPSWTETAGTLLVEPGTLAFFSQEPAATLYATRNEVKDLALTRVGPLDAFTFVARLQPQCFLLRDGAEFYEALSEMFARESEPTLRLRTLSAKFAARAPEIVRNSFSVADTLKNPAAAQSFMRLVELVTRAGSASVAPPSAATLADS